MAYSIPDSNAHCLKNPMPITAEGYVPASPEPGVCVPDEELLSQSQFTKKQVFQYAKDNKKLGLHLLISPSNCKSNPKSDAHLT